MTDVRLSHPSPDRLAAFRLQRLDEAAATEIQAHLADCPACRHMLEALSPDSLMALLQASAPHPPPGSEHTQSKNLGEAPTIAPATTPRPDSAALPAQHVPAELADHPRYRVLELLGAGGMGCVYKAEHRLMERQVALKVISRSLTDDRDAIERFRREVKGAARLSHPNIVAAHDAEQAGDTHFLVMEYVEGIDLAHRVVEQGPLPVALACEYVRQAALGLQHAHERGLVHRDIKPQNLMVTPAGQVKILDFGLARFLRESTPSGALTQLGTVMGTPDYIAPEQGNDARTADIRADIYSLGCTLYFLLTGQAPFPHGSLMQKLIAHLQETPRPLREFRKDVPPGLAPVIERMMAKLPIQRYQTPAEVAQVLASFASSLPVAEVRESVMDVVACEDAEPSTVAACLPDAVAIDPPTSTRSGKIPKPELPGEPTPGSSRGRSTRGVMRAVLVESEDTKGIPSREKPARREDQPVSEFDDSELPPADTRPMTALGLGITSLVLGIVAILFSWVPCMGVLSLPFSIIGLLLGGAGTVLALFQRGRGIGFAISGTIVNLVALILAVVITWVLGYLLDYSAMPSWLGSSGP